MIKLVRWLFGRPAQKKRIRRRRACGYHKSDSFIMLFTRILGLEGGTIAVGRLIDMLADPSHTPKGLRHRLLLMHRSGLVKMYGPAKNRRVRLNTTMPTEQAFEYFNRWLAEQGRRKKLPDTAQAVLEAA